LPVGGLALWHVTDPGNVGTLIRTADAFGASVALSEGLCRPDGAESAARICRSDLPRTARLLRQAGEGWRVALTAHEGEPLDGSNWRTRTVVRPRRGA
jgi:TrmH family RNA methyltransferase